VLTRRARRCCRSGKIAADQFGPIEIVLSDDRPSFAGPGLRTLECPKCELAYRALAEGPMKPRTKRPARKRTRQGPQRNNLNKIGHWLSAGGAQMPSTIASFRGNATLQQATLAKRRPQPVLGRLGPAMTDILLGTRDIQAHNVEIRFRFLSKRPHLSAANLDQTNREK
jgi:hypothetical protein